MYKFIVYLTLIFFIKKYKFKNYKLKKIKNNDYYCLCNGNHLVYDYKINEYVHYQMSPTPKPKIKY